MAEFLRFVLSELRSILLILVVAGIGAMAILACVYYLHKGKYHGERPFPWAEVFLWLIFAGYVMAVLFATILRKTGGFRMVNLHLFRAWREAWNNFSVKNWANVLLNVAMFLPFGAILPFLSDKFRKWYLAIPAGFGFSLAIELVQLLVGRGVCDVDDLLCNTLGSAIGFFSIMFVRSLCHNKYRTAGTYGALALAPLVAIGSIFVVYHFQEYGNLPQASAYTYDTRDTVWTLADELPGWNGEAPVYQNQVRSIEDCDTFAEAFKQIIPTEYNTVSYYEEGAWYMDNGSEGGAHFLTVNYMDQGYEYRGLYDDDLPWADADQETLKKALEKYPLEIPVNAEFLQEGEGWHCFTAHQILDGDTLFDGTLRVRYAQNGTIREIQNSLLRCNYFDTVPVISPEEAFDLLRAGKFNDDGYFEHIAPAEITVRSCVLDYEIDTKGFYQPVYRFDLKSTDGRYQSSVVIPAMQ